MADLSKLEAAHDKAAKAIGAFERDWAKIEAEWAAKRREVNDAYKTAFAELEEARGGPGTCPECHAQTTGGQFCANCGEPLPEPQVITPDGAAAASATGQVG